jgi:hypothetical protein
MKNWLLLLALIVVPVWAADTAPAPSSGESSVQAAQTAPKHKANKHKAKKTEKKAAASATATSTDTTNCYKLICGGVAGCFTRGCLSSCTGC